MLKGKVSRLTAVVLAVLMVGALLCACAGSGDYDYASGGEIAYDGGSYSANGSASGSSGSSSSKTVDVTDTSRKIIESYTYSVETKTFDTFVTELEKTVKSLGGYIENSNTYTGSYSEYASTDYTLRVPSDKSDELATFISENATVLSSSVDTEDVTLRYVDVESRLKALRTEQKSLEELLEASDTVSDIIEVRDRLTDVIYEIESYESQLRSMDTDIEYTTFSISVSEVAHETTAAEASVWQKIGDNLGKNFEIVGEFFQMLFIALISGLPFWLLMGGIAVLTVVIVKLCLRRSRKKRAQREAFLAAQPAAAQITAVEETSAEATTEEPRE